MDYLFLIPKLIGSSLLALALLAILHVSFFASQRLFGRQILSYAISVLTLLIITFVSLLFFTRSLNDFQFTLTNSFTLERIFGEFIVSAIMVISFMGTRLFLLRINKVFGTNRLPTALVSGQQSVGQPPYEKIENGQFRQLLDAWIEREAVRPPLSTRDLLDFFAEKYWEIQNVTTDKLLGDYLHICQIDVQHPPMEQEIVLYDINNPEESRIISIDDHILIVSHETAVISLWNYSEVSELRALKDLSRLRAEILDR